MSDVIQLIKISDIEMFELKAANVLGRSKSIRTPAVSCL